MTVAPGSVPRTRVWMAWTASHRDAMFREFGAAPPFPPGVRCYLAEDNTWSEWTGTEWKATP